MCRMVDGEGWLVGRVQGRGSEPWEGGCPPRLTLGMLPEPEILQLEQSEGARGERLRQGMAHGAGQQRANGPHSEDSSGPLL